MTYGWAPLTDRGAGRGVVRGLGYRVRRAGLVTAGAGCLVAGVLLVWRVTRPDVLLGVGTLELAAVVGLLVLPGLTLGALRLERTTRP